MSVGFFYFGRVPPGRAIRCKSSHFLRQTVGFPLLSLTQTDTLTRTFIFIYHNYTNTPLLQSCHFDEGDPSVSEQAKQIFASKSATKI